MSFIINNLKNKKTILVFYPHDILESYESKLYDDGVYWHPHLMNLSNNNNDNDNDKNIEVRLSVYFDRYFNKNIIIDFMKSLYNKCNRRVFMIGVVYREWDNIGNILYDVLPCFTETCKINEEKNSGVKRLHLIS